MQGKTLLAVLVAACALTLPQGRTPAAARPLASEPAAKTFRIYETVAETDELVILEFKDKKKPKFKKEVRVPVGRRPWRARPDPVGERFVLVSNSKDNTVSRVELAGGTPGRPPRVAAVIPVGRQPFDIAITPDGTHAFVANFKSKSLSVIDLATNKVVQTVKVGRSPVDLSMDPDGEFVVVANHRSRSVTFVDIADAIAGRIGRAEDTARGNETIKVAGRPEGVSAYRFLGARAGGNSSSVVSGGAADGAMMAETVSSTHRTILGPGGVLAKAALEFPCFAVLRNVPVHGAIVLICLNEDGDLVAKGFHPLQEGDGFQSAELLPGLFRVSNVARDRRLFVDSASGLLPGMGQIAVTVNAETTMTMSIVRHILIVEFDPSNGYMFKRSFWKPLS